VAKIIDIHAHAFPDKVAEKAAFALGQFYCFPVENEATRDGLMNSANEAEVEKVVVHSTATVPTQVESINNYMASLASDLFVPFGSMHPEYHDIEGELSRISDIGLHGLKLHPDYQQFDADDKRLHKIYKKLQDLKLPLLIHGGDPRREYSRPHKIARIKDVAPDLTIIVAHMGGHRCHEEADKYLIGKDFYIDTSSALWYLQTDDATSIIKKHGVEKVLFGTDYPVSNHVNELRRFNYLGLTEAEKEDILYNNAKKLLGL
jgi:predicted TIM-barrel fold metal-dependent hydrolase